MDKYIQAILDNLDLINIDSFKKRPDFTVNKEINRIYGEVRELQVLLKEKYGDI